jgi:hypothetical protein
MDTGRVTSGFMGETVELSVGPQVGKTASRSMVEKSSIRNKGRWACCQRHRLDFSKTWASPSCCNFFPESQSSHNVVFYLWVVVKLVFL